MEKFTTDQFKRNHLVDSFLRHVVGQHELGEAVFRVTVEDQARVFGECVVALATPAAHVQPTNLPDPERSVGHGHGGFTTGSSFPGSIPSGKIKPRKSEERQRGHLNLNLLS